jgi:hypothetical protein
VPPAAISSARRGGSGTPSLTGVTYPKSCSLRLFRPRREVTISRVHWSGALPLGSVGFA